MSVHEADIQSQALETPFEQKDQASYSNIVKHSNALNYRSELRASRLNEIKQKLSEPNYPSQKIIQTLAGQFIAQWEQAEK